MGGRLRPLALAVNTDYHAIGVLIICTLYLTRADRKRQCLAGALLFLFELTAPLAFVLVWFYNGQRGACSPLQKKPFTGSTRCTCWCWQVSRTLCYNSRKPAVQRQRAFYSFSHREHRTGQQQHGRHCDQHTHGGVGHRLTGKGRFGAGLLGQHSGKGCRPGSRR